MLEERITARLPAHIKDKLQQAAEIEGATLNQFLVQSALDRALDIIERERVINLSYDDAKNFFENIENPPAPNKKLCEAVARYRVKDITKKDIPSDAED